MCSSSASRLPSLYTHDCTVLLPRNVLTTDPRLAHFFSLPASASSGSPGAGGEAAESDRRAPSPSPSRRLRGISQLVL
ncbi:hypothetical protein ZWY2020_044925 [Hordeum vulgare]|nr:hypothetical protein ZWY2020_044925 [Hordeum vulgare]